MVHLSRNYWRRSHSALRQGGSYPAVCQILALRSSHVNAIVTVDVVMSKIFMVKWRSAKLSTISTRYSRIEVGIADLANLIHQGAKIVALFHESVP